MNRIYQAPDRADFRLKDLNNAIWQPSETAPQVEEDFCGQPLPDKANPGPIQYLNGLDCLATSSVANPG
jgi:hypothetical protein